MTIVTGEILLTRNVDLFWYLLIFFMAASFFVRFYEEPYLKSQFGESYERYVRDVGRWLPRMRKPGAQTAN
jgi:protein-S-isoprenylcysteine O-methyltransferase Ste14